jgi:acyl-CoA synthetase (AMP-forming)/AMP-acid ligase II
VLRTFRDIEERARDLATKIDIFHPASIVAVQIGNHADWPSILLACVRARLIILPIEQSISEQQRSIALFTCRCAGAITAKADDLGIKLANDAAAPSDWNGAPPSLLKLTSGTTAAPRAIRFSQRAAPRRLQSDLRHNGN